jgi:hypothetical protein
MRPPRLIEKTKGGILSGMALPRKKTSVYLDPELLQAAKVVAAATGRHDYEVIEEALRQYLSQHGLAPGRAALLHFMDQMAQRADLSDEDALQLAVSEQHAARQERQLGE